MQEASPDLFETLTEQFRALDAQAAIGRVVAGSAIWFSAIRGDEHYVTLAASTDEASAQVVELGQEGDYTPIMLRPVMLRRQQKELQAQLGNGVTQRVIPGSIVRYPEPGQTDFTIEQIRAFNEAGIDPYTI